MTPEKCSVDPSQDNDEVARYSEAELRKLERKRYHKEWLARNPGRAAIYKERQRIRMAKRYARPEIKAAEAARRKTPEYKARKAAYRKRSRSQRSSYHKEYNKRPEVKAANRKRRLAYLSRPEAKALRKASYLRNKDKQRDKRRESYQTDPIVNLTLRMSSAVRGSLHAKSPKNGSPWLELVGYTAIQLRCHLERQFTKGMGWHNMSKWHIDHIVPLSAFKYVSAKDPEFLAAWALSNLRPLWKIKNIRKNAKREFLL